MPEKLLESKLKFFTDQIQYIEKSSIGTPKKLRIDLSVAHADLMLSVTGNFFYIIETNATNDMLDIKVNEQREPSFSFYRGMGLLTPFYRLFITNAVQVGGYAIILYGTQAPDFLEVIDNRGVTIPALDAILNELQGDTTPENFNQVAVGAAAGVIIAANVNRKSAIIQHKRGGVGIIYLGYDNTVMGNKHFISLAPNEVYSVDDYRGAIWGIRSAGATNAMYGEV